MNRFAKTRILWIGMAMAAAGTLSAADDLPKADTILDKYLEVTGGKAAYAKLHSQSSTGVMELSAMGLKGKMVAYHAEPDRSLVEVTIEGVGKMTEGTGGETAWSVNSMQGPRVKDGAERSQALLNARFNSELHWKDLYPHVETEGIEAIDGKDCYKVVLTPKSGNPVTRWYDKESGLLVKTRTKANTAMGEIEADTILSDYRKEGEILMAHKMVQHAASFEMAVTLESVQHNPEIPKEKFEQPDEIKALAKTAK
jgi:outer membrane lipoprotein-sorting protein